jgi:hypothetical protein
VLELCAGIARQANSVAGAQSSVPEILNVISAVDNNQNTAVSFI